MPPCCSADIPGMGVLKDEYSCLGCRWCHGLLRLCAAAPARVPQLISTSQAVRCPHAVCPRPPARTQGSGQSGILSVTSQRRENSRPRRWRSGTTKLTLRARGARDRRVSRASLWTEKQHETWKFLGVVWGGRSQGSKQLLLSTSHWTSAQKQTTRHETRGRLDASWSVPLAAATSTGCPSASPVRYTAYSIEYTATGYTQVCSLKTFASRTASFRSEGWFP